MGTSLYATFTMENIEPPEEMAYKDLFPHIQEERPDIIEKLMILRNSREEDKKQRIKAAIPNR